MMGKTDDETVVRLATRIPGKLHWRVRVFCRKRKVSMASFLTAAVREKIAKDIEDKNIEGGKGRLE